MSRPPALLPSTFNTPSPTRPRRPSGSGASTAPMRTEGTFDLWQKQALSRVGGPAGLGLSSNSTTAGSNGTGEGGKRGGMDFMLQLKGLDDRLGDLRTLRSQAGQDQPGRRKSAGVTAPGGSSSRRSEDRERDDGMAGMTTRAKAKRAVEKYERSRSRDRDPTSTTRETRRSKDHADPVLPLSSSRSSLGVRVDGPSSTRRSTRKPSAVLKAPRPGPLEPAETSMEKAFSNLMAEADAEEARKAGDFELDRNEYDGDADDEEAGERAHRRKGRRSAAAPGAPVVVGGEKDKERRRSKEDRLSSSQGAAAAGKAPTRGRARAKTLEGTPVVGAPVMGHGPKKPSGTLQASTPAALGLGSVSRFLGVLGRRWVDASASQPFASPPPVSMLPHADSPLVPAGPAYGLGLGFLPTPSPPVIPSMSARRPSTSTTAGNTTSPQPLPLRVSGKMRRPQTSPPSAGAATPAPRAPLLGRKLETSGGGTPVGGHFDRLPSPASASSIPALVAATTASSPKSSVFSPLGGSELDLAKFPEPPSTVAPVLAKEDTLAPLPTFTAPRKPPLPPITASNLPAIQGPSSTTSSKSTRRRSASVGSPLGLSTSSSYRQFIATMQEEDRKTQARALQKMLGRSPAADLAAEARPSFSADTTIASRPTQEALLAKQGPASPPRPAKQSASLAFPTASPVLSPPVPSAASNNEPLGASTTSVPPSPDVAEGGRGRKVSLTSFRLPKLLGKKRKDEDVPPLPASGSLASLPQTQPASPAPGTPKSPPTIGQVEGATPVPAPKTLKKKRSFGQRIARRLSLSNLKGELDSSSGLASPPVPSPALSSGWSSSFPSAPPTPASLAVPSFSASLAASPPVTVSSVDGKADSIFSNPSPLTEWSAASSVVPSPMVLTASRKGSNPPAHPGLPVDAAAKLHLGLLTPSASDRTVSQFAAGGNRLPDRPASSILAAEDLTPGPEHRQGNLSRLDLGLGIDSSLGLDLSGWGLGEFSRSAAPASRSLPAGCAAPSFDEARTATSIVESPTSLHPAPFSPLQTTSDAGGSSRAATFSETGRSGSSRQPSGWDSPPTDDEAAARKDDDDTSRQPSRGNSARADGGNSSDSDDKASSVATGELVTADEAESDASDDSDDVPLGQRHPDAADIQKSLQAERAHRHARRQAREAAKKRKLEEAKLKAQKLAKEQEKAKQEAERKLEAAKAKAEAEAKARREAEAAAEKAKKEAAAKLADDQPLAQLVNRQDSKGNPPLKNPFAITPEELANRLQRVAVVQQSTLSRNSSTSSAAHSTVGHALLPQTDASARSRKQSFGPAEPLSPYVGQSVLTFGDGNDSQAVTPTQQSMPRQRKGSGPAPAAAPVEQLAVVRKPTRNNKDLSINTDAASADTPKRSQTISAARISSSAANIARGLTTRKTPTLPPADHITPFPVAVAPKTPTDPTSARVAPTPKTAIRVAIGDASKTLILEIDSATRPTDLLDMIRSKGLLRATEGELGEWAVFEVWKDLGLERPIREVETISTVMATWTPNSESTFLVAKPSPIGGLAAANRPVTSGPHGGQLHCELKPGKWTKRYVVLQNQAIYLCANDKGKDEIFLCTLSNFDVYQVPPSGNTKLNPPRACAFGIKSLDKLSFFETQTDYVHHFAVKDPATANEWLRRIYDARTFVILRTKAATESAAADKAAEAARQQRKRSNSAAASNPVSRSASTASRQAPATAGLSRQGTLLGDVDPRTFRQGTLLGDLDLSVTPAVPALPHHINTTTPAASMPLRSKAWEAMGPAERRGLIMEAQARAKQDGKTLLSFPETGAVASGLSRAKSTAANRPRRPSVGATGEKDASRPTAPLGRSQTVAARPARPA